MALFQRSGPLGAAGAALAAVAGLLSGCGDEPRAAADPSCGATLSEPRETGVALAATATLCLLNAERAKRGLPPLADNPMLARVAARHSADMVARRYFEHDSPDGTTPQDRLRTAGYARGTSRSTGENIAWGRGDSGTPAAIVEQWMNSPAHRADILRPAFREVGVGIALGVPTAAGRGDDGATYTTDFGGVVDDSLEPG